MTNLVKGGVFSAIRVNHRQFPRKLRPALGAREPGAKTRLLLCLAPILNRSCKVPLADLTWVSSKLAPEPISGYISRGIWKVRNVGSRAQKRAITNYRSRLIGRGIVRFELQAFEADRDLIRALARKLVEQGPDAGQIRRTVRQAVSGEPRKPGGILAALRRSPLVGADLDLTRPPQEGREVDL
jgi:hypothetical protein